MSNSQSQENIYAVDKWEIPVENICFGELIGEGAFGKVYFARLSKISIPYGQSNLASEKLRDGAGQARKTHKGNESSTAVAVKTIQSMVTVLLIEFLEQSFAQIDVGDRELAESFEH